MSNKYCVHLKNIFSFITMFLSTVVLVISFKICYYWTVIILLFSPIVLFGKFYTSLISKRLSWRTRTTCDSKSHDLIAKTISIPCCHWVLPLTITLNISELDRKWGTLCFNTCFLLLTHLNGENNFKIFTYFICKW